MPRGSAEEKPPHAGETRSTFPTPQLGVRRSVQRLVTSRWVSRRDEGGRPLRILGRVYDVTSNTLSPVDYIIAEPGENWNAIARRANRGVSVLREANRWADPDQLGVNEVLYVPPPRRSKR